MSLWFKGTHPEISPNCEIFVQFCVDGICVNHCYAVSMVRNLGETLHNSRANHFLHFVVMWFFRSATVPWAISRKAQSNGPSVSEVITKLYMCQALRQECLLQAKFPTSCCHRIILMDNKRTQKWIEMESKLLFPSKCRHIPYIPSRWVPQNSPRRNHIVRPWCSTILLPVYLQHIIVFLCLEGHDVNRLNVALGHGDFAALAVPVLRRIAGTLNTSVIINITGPGYCVLANFVWGQLSMNLLSLQYIIWKMSCFWWSSKICNADMTVWHHSCRFWANHFKTCLDGRSGAVRLWMQNLCVSTQTQVSEGFSPDSWKL